MKNPHIIVGPNHQCLCGSYTVGETTRAVACSDIITAIEHIKSFNKAEFADDVNVLEAVVQPLLEDRP